MISIFFCLVQNFNFILQNDDQCIVLSSFKVFLKNKVEFGVVECDQIGEFFFEIVKEFGVMGIMGVQIFEEYGGVGFDSVIFVMIIEEIVVVDGLLCLIVVLYNLLCQGYILIGGSEEQKCKFLFDFVSVQKFGVWGLIEFGSGLDSGGMFFNVKE